VSVVGGLVGRLPLGLAQRLGAGLGRVAYWILRGRRQVALDNLALVYGDTLPPAARATLARRSFEHLGMTAMECCRLFFGPADRLLTRVRGRGTEYLGEAMARGRGIFFLTGHFGNWELLAATHGLAGFGLSVVVRPLDNPYLDSVIARARQRSGLRAISKREAVQGVREALARGECIGILLDQDAGRDGVFVPFLGRPASTSRALAVLALKTRAPVVPAFIHRLPDGGHELVLDPEIPLAITGDLDHDIDVNTARFTEAIERHVRAHPEQWFWVHRRWKSQPGMSREPARRRLGALLLAAAIAGTPGLARAVGEDPGAEIAEALKSMGPPGLVWGRLSVEEESPVGPVTPLEGVEVSLYPATPTLVAELERIRQGARGSASQYESAIARVQTTLAVHQGRVDRLTAQPPTLGDLLVAEPSPVTKPRAEKPAAPAPESELASSPFAGSWTRRSRLPPRGAPATRRSGTTGAPAPDEPEPHPWRQKTDPAGLFAFSGVPSGDWLVVAVRTAPYAAEKLRAAPKPKASSRTQGFMPRATGPAKEVEIWVTRIHVVKDERVALDLTDRARWLVGPIR
jgi:KDO2-lipid IV(A) lauroyltransferase